MKKLALTTVCVMVAAGAAFAQGTVNFSTINAAAFVVSTNSTAFSPLFGGGSAVGGSVGLTGLGANNYYYELLYNTAYQGNNSPIATPTFGQLFGGTWLDTQLGANNSVGNQGSATPNVASASTQAVVPWSHGISNNIIMVGWSANLGTSWLTVSNELATGSFASVLAGENGYFGVSTAGVLNPGTANPGPSAFGLNPVANVGRAINSQDTQMYLLPVPEPATMALVGLGGLSLLLFRRQRK